MLLGAFAYKLMKFNEDSSWFDHKSPPLGPLESTPRLSIYSLSSFHRSRISVNSNDDLESEEIRSVRRACQHISFNIKQSDISLSQVFTSDSQNNPLIKLVGLPAKLHLCAPLRL